jgi:pimeloyl-ACP methyl ester carboxylesterase
VTGPGMFDTARSGGSTAEDEPVPTAVIEEASAELDLLTAAAPDLGLPPADDLVSDPVGRARPRTSGAGPITGQALTREVRSSILHLVERFRPAEAIGLNARWHIRVHGHGAYTIHVREGACFISVGEGSEADAVIDTDAETWLDIAAGRQDGVAAFARHRLWASGDLNLALRLDTLFLPGPEATRFLRTARTDVKGMCIDSFIAGRGKPVLLLHGLCASKVSWLPTIDGLAGRYEVHALDLPGFGHSDKPLPAGGRYSARWMASVVNGYMRAHGLHSAHIVGNSMGGRIAVELGLRHPRRVETLVGLGTAVAFDEWQWARPFLRLLQGQWLGMAPFPLRQEWVETGIVDLFGDLSTVPRRNVVAAAQEFIRGTRDRRHRLAIMACARHIGKEPANGRRSFWRRIEALRMPSYWIWGSTDRLSSCRYAEKVRSCCPDAQVEIWDGVGHVPQFEQPDRTNEAILGFIGGARS